MNVRFDTEQIEMLMRSLYMLTGIRFVLFDTDFHEVIAYPREGCDFCKLMKGCSKTRRKCNYADRRSFEKCEKENALVIYKCHTGLNEAVMPLHENERIIGYLMFGQLADVDSKAALYQTVEGLCEKYGFEKATLTSAVDTLTCKSEEEIAAAAKIMEACTSYIIYKELITPENNRIIEAAKAYIEAHPEMQTDVTALCGELGVGRTRLYELFKAETGMGVAAYIRRRKMHRAKKLLKTTTLSIDEIAQAVGFADYNYFSRVYKKTYGKSPKRYR